MRLSEFISRPANANKTIEYNNWSNINKTTITPEEADDYIVLGCAYFPDNKIEVDILKKKKIEKSKDEIKN